MSRRSSGSGSVPEDMYDGRHNIAIDSPISAADMLSRAARQKRRGTSRRSSVFDESQYARSSAGITPTKRLFPDTPEVQRLGLTPTSRNHSQRKSKRARRSQYDEEEDERVNDRGGEKRVNNG